MEYLPYILSGLVGLIILFALIRLFYIDSKLKDLESIKKLLALQLEELKKLNENK